MNSVRQLADMLGARQPCVVLTGAGVSTASGIPDFRSRTGMWAEVDPQEVASLSAFRRDPERVWRFYRRRIEVLTAAEPNRAHLALAALERAGLVHAVITQNIDMLHERAGSRTVVEVHGSIRTSTCPGCRARYPLPQVLAMLRRSAAAPRCTACSTVVKPDVVFFEELLPREAIDRAYELARAAALLLVVGSSLEVHPVAGLPAVARSAGAAVAIVNRGATTFDARATLVLDADAGEALDSLLGLM